VSHAKDHKIKVVDRRSPGGRKLGRAHVDLGEGTALEAWDNTEAVPAIRPPLVASWALAREANSA